LVQVFHKYGLRPIFKDNLEKWSNDLHCVVQLLKKIPQTEENDKHAQECIDILFEPAKTEHYGYFSSKQGNFFKHSTGPFIGNAIEWFVESLACICKSMLYN
jgi:hypothetical protein